MTLKSYSNLQWQKSAESPLQKHAPLTQESAGWHWPSNITQKEVPNDTCREVALTDTVYKAKLTVGGA